MDLVARPHVQSTDQHPRLTVAWAMRSLERALQSLGDGRAERRVRGQFHQLVLAIERQESIDEESNKPAMNGESPNAA